MSRGAVMALHETWVFMAPLPNGLWEVRCTRCNLREQHVLTGAALRSLDEHTCQDKR